VNRFRAAFPRSPAEAAALLRQVADHGGRPLIVGGGTLTVPMLGRDELTATHVVDLGRIGADQITESAAGIRLGAMTSYQQLISSRVIAEKLPLLHRMASGITGGIQIRGQGTLGGSACAARPASDAPAVLVALRARMVLRSAAGPRQVAADDFFLAAQRPDVRAGEFLLELDVPPDVAGRAAGYYKLKFGESSWPVVTAACLLPSPGCPRAPADLVLGGVGDVPVRVPLPVRLDGDVGRDTISRAVTDRISSLPAEHRWSDLRAGSGYRFRVAGEVAYRAIRRALSARGNVT
jgi:aerobic carbon-monoxide dehydrogenase medium subunit